MAGPLAGCYKDKLFGPSASTGQNERRTAAEGSEGPNVQEIGEESSAGAV